MSGHNKWSKIKHKKEAMDAGKSRSFSKFLRLIQNESKKSGGDVNSAGLRAAILSAKKENVPKANIERAVEKGAGGGEENLISATYEAYGPEGAAIIIETLSDSTNRTGSELRRILAKHGLFISPPRAASWAFKKTGDKWRPSVFVKISESGREKLEAALEALSEHDDVLGLYANAE